MASVPGPTTQAFKVCLAGIVAGGVPWLPLAQIYLTRPAVPYAGPCPWALLRAPDLTGAHTTAGTVGSLRRPNTYLLWYFESVYPNAEPTGAPPGGTTAQWAQAISGDDAALAAAEARVDATFDALVRAFIPPVGDLVALPDGQYAAGLEVRMRTDPSGPYLTWGQQRWIGAGFWIQLEQEYE